MQQEFHTVLRRDSRCKASRQSGWSLLLPTMCVAWTVVCFAFGCSDNGVVARPVRPVDAPESQPALAQRPSTDARDPVGHSNGPPQADSFGTRGDTVPTDSAVSGTSPVLDRPVADSDPAQASRFRRSDDRPKHDDAALARAGIRRFESKRLILYTDTPTTSAEKLPPLVDALYAHLVEYFGPLQPTRESDDFQITGYIMRDRERFARAKLLPDELPQFAHERHLGYQFWMNDQKDDYYRRHLMLHEATHCFMTCETGNRDVPPVWFMEGMAEHFATHARQEGKTAFGVLPHNKPDFAGLGRITLIATRAVQKEGVSLDRLTAVSTNDFVKPEHYSYAWAACAFLMRHPHWSRPFRKLTRHKTNADFHQAFNQLIRPRWRELSAEYDLFVASLCDDFDLSRAAIDFVETQPLQGATTVSVRADRGWQSTGLQVDGGVTYRLTANGQFSVARLPKPWISEANGISLRYANGMPLGLLVARIFPEGRNSMTDPIRVGSAADIAVKQTGTLFLRLNDAWNELDDNSGELNVTVTRVAD